MTREDIAKADRIAYRLARRYRHLDREEVIAVARFGLVDAMDRYTDQGNSFWSYASFRIEGEIHELARRHIAVTVPLEEWHAETPDHLCSEWRILIRTLFGHVDGLGRDVLAGYYLGDQTQRQLAERLGVSETRISQVRRETLAMLRKRLRLPH